MVRMPESMVYGSTAIKQIRKPESRKSIAISSLRNILQQIFRDFIKVGHGRNKFEASAEGV
jgi:hypothetical protein